jgi:hypothetical protein
MLKKEVLLTITTPSSFSFSTEHQELIKSWAQVILEVKYPAHPPTLGTPVNVYYKKGDIIIKEAEPRIFLCTLPDGRSLCVIPQCEKKYRDGEHFHSSSWDKVELIQLRPNINYNRSIDYNNNAVHEWFIEYKV